MMSPSGFPLRIAVIDDHPVLRRGLCHLLTEQGWLVVLEAGTVQEAQACLGGGDWEILILDQMLPDGEGLDVLRWLREKGDSRPVLMHSTLPEEALALRVYKTGGNGYLNKGCSPEILLQAMQVLHEVGTYVSPTFAGALVGAVHNGEKPLHESLSDQEYQVLCKIAKGMSLSHIAEDMGLKLPTISTYRRRILEKLHLTTNIELARYALDHQLISRF